MITVIQQDPICQGHGGPLMYMWVVFFFVWLGFFFALSWILHATVYSIKKKSVVASVLLMESWDEATCSMRDETGCSEEKKKQAEWMIQLETSIYAIYLYSFLQIKYHF